eukprot:PhM_4_TR17560/c0_g2_i1/m.103896/K08857/NEK1_4_5; NIMA (never in mitosis gene a)-related kinase 1/4/5
MLDGAGIPVKSKESRAQVPSSTLPHKNQNAHLGRGCTPHTNNAASSSSSSEVPMSSGSGYYIFDKLPGVPPGARCKYEGVRVLGTGAFGEVWLLRHTSSNKQFVGKIMNFTNVSEKHREFVRREITCLAQCTHANIVQYIEAADLGSRFLIVMEYCEGGDLSKQISFRKKEEPYDEQEVLFIIVQLMLALDYIHSKKILHRDLKCANVLLTMQGLLKVGDFGFSRQYDNTISDAVGTTFCGTSYYIAPEIWRHEAYNKKADMYSLGVLLFEVLAMQRPFTGNEAQMVPDILSGQHAQLPRDRYSAELIELCEALLSVDPATRPDTRTMATLPFIQSAMRTFLDAVEQPELFPVDVSCELRAHVLGLFDCSVEVDQYMMEEARWLPNVRMRVTREGLQLSSTILTPCDVVLQQQRSDTVTGCIVLDLGLQWRSAPTAATTAHVSMVRVRCSAESVEKVMTHIRGVSE